MSLLFSLLQIISPVQLCVGLVGSYVSCVPLRECYTRENIPNVLVVNVCCHRPTETNQHHTSMTAGVAVVREEDEEHLQ